MASKLGELFVEIYGQNRRLFADLQASQQAVNKTATAMQTRMAAMSDSISASMALMARNMIISLGAVVSAGALIGMGKQAVSLAVSLEQAQIAFTTLLGSASAANKFLDELKEFAKQTPFELPGLIDASRRLLAYGFAAQEIIPTLRQIGDAVSGLGGGAFEIDRVIRALGQMRAKGKVSAEEMTQMAELGIPAWEMLAKAIGIDIPTAMKMAEKGQITGAQGIEAILSGMNARFGGAMENQMASLGGLWSNFKDSMTQALTSLGQLLIETFGFKNLTMAVTAFGNAWKSWLDWLKPRLVPIKNALAEMFRVVKEEGTRIWKEHGETLKRVMEMIVRFDFKVIATGILAIAKAVETMAKAFDWWLNLPSTKMLERIIAGFSRMMGWEAKPTAEAGPGLAGATAMAGGTGEKGRDTGAGGGMSAADKAVEAWSAALKRQGEISNALAVAGATARIAQMEYENQPFEARRAKARLQYAEDVTRPFLSFRERLEQVSEGMYKFWTTIRGIDRDELTVRREGIAKWKDTAEDELERRRQAVRFTSIEELGRSFRVRGAQAAFAVPPEIEQVNLARTSAGYLRQLVDLGQRQITTLDRKLAQLDAVLAPGYY